MKTNSQTVTLLMTGCLLFC